MIKKSKLIIFNITLIIGLLIMLIAIFVQDYFGAMGFDQVLFHLFVPINGTEGNFLSVGLAYVLSKFGLIIVIYLLFLYLLSKLKIVLEVKIFKQKINIDINQLVIKIRWIFIVGLIIFSGYIFNKNLDLINYIKYNTQATNIFENYYIDPQKTEIIFPKNKNNLIFIIFESLETTDLSQTNGGYRNKSLIPEIEKISLNNINFSQNDKLGGYYSTNGTGYTIAGMIGLTTGVPLLVGNNDLMESYKYVLKKAYSMGEILESEGYKNYFMMGSNESFAGRGQYFKQHGNYEIFDFSTAKELNYIDQEYDINWWGFEDKKLYEYAKIKLNDISKNDEPFNLSLLTVDTHPFEGYTDETCEIDDSLNKYENVFACSSKMLNDFINWIKKQPFYENTTIVIVGDHLNMASNTIHKNMPNSYDRTVYNTFINSAVKAECNKNRIFTTFDIYPTTLAAMGAKIKGERLALGTNLFSCEKTISEELGLQYFNDELRKKSNYYNYCLFLGKCQ